jgi:hypothetical protein
MARRVFFSFHYQEDIWRVNQIRHVGVTKDWEAMPFLDAASWEAVKRKGDAAVKGWIDRQLDGTGVTVVLIGSQTAVQGYEVRGCGPGRKSSRDQNPTSPHIPFLSKKEDAGIGWGVHYPPSASSL